MVLMTNLSTILLIVFGFNVVNIFALSFMVSPLVVYLSDSVVGYNGILGFRSFFFLRRSCPVRSVDTTCR